jgi:predicted hydrocarbon binding protein
VIVNDNWRVQELECEASGADACVFTFCTLGQSPQVVADRSR